MSLARKYTCLHEIFVQMEHGQRYDNTKTAFYALLQKTNFLGTEISPVQWQKLA
jgi:hypothetical protein